MSARAAYDVVIAGAGVSGVAAARYLARTLPPSARIAVVTKHAPCQYTSSLSTECFRDHWPTQSMRSFMGRSISLLHEQGREHQLNVSQAGYLYVTGDAGGEKALLDEARACHGHEGPGAVRVFRGGSSPGAGRASSSTSSSTSSSSSQQQLATGADVYADPSSLRSAFPWLDPSLTAGMHARNAGWTSAHTMGVSLLEEARGLKTPGGEARVVLVRGEVDAVDTGPDFSRVRGVRVRLERPAGGSGEAAAGEHVHLSTPVYVNAGGPFVCSAHEAMFVGGGVAGGSSPSLLSALPPTRSGAPRSAHSLPVFSEVHSKVIFRDTLRVIPRDAPMTIANHAMTLPWAEGELEYIAETAGAEAAERLGGLLPAGAHFRPYGGAGSDAVLMLWECWHHHPPVQEKVTEPPSEGVEHLLDMDLYPDVVLRGLSRLVPDLAAYFDEDAGARLQERRRKREGGGGGGGSGDAGGDAEAAGNTGRKPTVDGGYYTKTEENVPLIGPAPGAGRAGGVAGAYICGAVSGYGVMAAHAAGELLAAHVCAGTADGSSGSAAATLAAVGSTGGASGSGAAKEYAALMSPMRYQWGEFTAKGGWRDQLLAAGGGQL